MSYEVPRCIRVLYDLLLQRFRRKWCEGWIEASQTLGTSWSRPGSYLGRSVNFRMHPGSLARLVLRSLIIPSLFHVLSLLLAGNLALIPSTLSLAQLTTSSIRSKSSSITLPLISIYLLVLPYPTRCTTVEVSKQAIYSTSYLCRGLRIRKVFLLKPSPDIGTTIGPWKHISMVEQPYKVPPT
jgi:hypothetical protein